MTEPEDPFDLPDVGTVDDTEPIELEEGDESEAPVIPDTWDPSAHADEYNADPLVVFTDDDPDEDDA